MPKPSTGGPSTLERCDFLRNSAAGLGREPLIDAPITARAGRMIDRSRGVTPASIRFEPDGLPAVPVSGHEQRAPTVSLAGIRRDALPGDDFRSRHAAEGGCVVYSSAVAAQLLDCCFTLFPSVKRGIEIDGTEADHAKLSCAIGQGNWSKWHRRCLPNRRDETGDGQIEPFAFAARARRCQPEPRRSCSSGRPRPMRLRRHRRLRWSAQRHRSSGQRSAPRRV